jgi:hypothetical protein
MIGQQKFAFRAFQADPGSIVPCLTDLMKLFVPKGFEPSSAPGRCSSQALSATRLYS